MNGGNMGSSIYEAYARSVYKARADIRQLQGRFTVFDQSSKPPAEGEAGDWDLWLKIVDAGDSVHNNTISTHRRAGNTVAADSAEQTRSNEVATYNTAVRNLQDNLPELRELESTGESFCATDDATSEFRYIVDEGAKKYFWMEQRGLTGLVETEFDLANCTTHFLGPKCIGLVDNQTDAVRIQANNVVLRSIEIRDERGHSNVAHRDGVQLIPPNLMDEGRILIDRMAGSVVSGIHVDQCTIDAPLAELQGIFSSDGFCRNLTISNNTIKTAAGHFISIAGALDGCKISDNILQQASDNIPKIKLYPGRLGGNIADDGIVYILSFASNSEYNYCEVENTGNEYIGLNQEALPDQFSDERDRIPASHGQVALGLRNFDYTNYMETYSRCTVADFKNDYPIGYLRLQAWLEQRVEEYETGERTELDRENYPILADPTEEQKTRVIYTLCQALDLLCEESEEFLSTRVADLQSMPIRSFIIKRLAVSKGEIVLEPLNPDDVERRTAQLKWFLDTELAVDYSDDIPAITSQELPKNYGELKIRATPIESIQGETITFSINEMDYMLPGDTASYFWTVKGHTSTKPEFELVTSEWTEGEHNVRATLYVRPSNGGFVKQIPGSALFVVTPSESEATEAPLKAYGDLKEHFQVNHARINHGEKLVVSLNPALIDTAQQGATLKFYWTVSDYPVSHTPIYEIDTAEIPPKEHLIRVTMYRTDLATNQQEQFSGSAVVEVLGISEPV